MQRIAVFCGANPGNQPTYAATARALGEALVRRSLGLVYGGGGVGLMGVLADAVLARRGEVIGVLPETLMTAELAHPHVADMRIVRTMHERKAIMAGLADAFIALPGGFGTLDESFEALTWLQLGFHAKPFGMLNVDGYYDDLLRFLDRAVDHSFLRAEHRAEIIVETDPETLLSRLDGRQPVRASKWLNREVL